MSTDLVSTLDEALAMARPGDVLDAVLLAIEGASDDSTALQIIERLVGAEPRFPEASTSTRLLLMAVRELGGAFTTADSPR